MKAKKNQLHSGKVGSDRQAARHVGGKGDFGAPEDNRVARDYASQTTKHGDPGASQGRIKSQGVRESGVGSNESGPGSGSGGDVDTDVIGFDGAGLSQAGPDVRAEGPDMTTGAGTVRGSTVSGDRNAKPVRTVRGSTVDHTGGDASTTGEGQGAGAVSNPSASDDDSFEGEVSEGEAMGQDN